jgi:hypothetical protein
MAQEPVIKGELGPWYGKGWNSCYTLQLLTDISYLLPYCDFPNTVKSVFNRTWIKRKPVLNEQILWSREYSTKIHIK